MQAGHVTFQFGRYTLDPAHRRLLADDAPVSLSSRAFDILQMLVESRDRVLGKDEIITQVWRGMAVEENNLAVQISALRRALSQPGEAALITTVPGQGYRFVGEVAERIATPIVVAGPVEAQPHAPSPAPVAVTQGRRGWMLPASGIAALVLAAVLWLVVRPGVRAPEQAPRLSLVVLPFRNLSGDAKQDYLADAVSDDLTTDLSHIPGSTVIARASSDTYKGRAVAADVIGRALHVRYLLEGSIRGEDGMFRINAQLIDTASGAHLWADRFDVTQGKISDAQTDIVRHIASALNVTLVAIEGARSLHERPDDPDALDLFFRARSIMGHDDTLAGFTQVQALLEKALALQPDFGGALSELGWVLLTKINNFDDPQEEQDFARAKQVIEKALSLPGGRADALASQGFLYTKEGRYQEAIASYEAALAIDRNNVRSHAGEAYCQWQLGQPEAAVSLLTVALRLDPVGPSVKLRYQLLGMASFMAGQYSAAIDWLHRSLAGDPDPTAGSDSLSRVEFSNLFLIAAVDRAGDRAAAAEAYKRYRVIWPYRSVWRLATYFTPQQAMSKGFASFREALEEAGMPRFADETAALLDAPNDDRHKGGDFSPPPAHIPGASVIDAKELAALLQQPHPPKVIDVGVGAIEISNAVLADDHSAGWEATIGKVLASDQASGLLGRERYAILGTGPYGWESYLAARRFAEAGAKEVFWFRGGEEAWAEAAPSSAAPVSMSAHQ